MIENYGAAIFIFFSLILGFVFAYVLGIIRCRRIENVLLKSETRYRQIIETAQEGIIIVSLSGEILFSNKRFASMLGYPVDEIIGMPSKQLLPGDQAEQVQNARGRLSRGEAVQEKMRFKRKDGSILWTQYNATPLFDEDGIHIGNLAMHTDITERKGIEDELEAREKLYSLMIGKLPNSQIYILDKALKVHQAGGSLLDKTGFSPEMLKNKALSDIFTPELISTITASLEKAFSGEESACETFAFNMSWLNIFFPVSDMNGSIDRICILSVNITRLKNVENELLLAQEKLKLAVDTANIGLWEWDFENDVVTLDQRTEKMLCLETGNYKPSFETIGNLIQEEDLQYVKRSLNQVIKTGTRNEAVFRVRPSNNELKYLYIKSFLSRTIKGAGEKVTGTLTDVTSIKKGAEQVLLKMNQELVRMNTELKQFVHFASHDLQEPLRSVSSFAQMLEMRYADKLDAAGKEYIKFVVDGVNRMYSLINGIASYSRATARADKFEKVRMNEVLEKVTRNLNLKIREKNAVIESRRLPLVYADGVQMMQVLQNLIDNSLKFCKKDPHITVSVRTTDEFHTFIVRDNGPGISPDHFEKAFMIFNRIGNEEPGRGLGLAICKRIVEGHGGKIWVESEPGKGASFMFTIPKYKFISPQ